MTSFVQWDAHAACAICGASPTGPGRALARVERGSGGSRGAFPVDSPIVSTGGSATAAPVSW